MENRQILIVDDNEKDRSAMLDTLGKLYYIYEAENGMDAIEHINNNDVDLVIMAYELPDMDGIDTFLDIKALRPSIPVILTSSYLIGELILKAFRLGVRDFFKKPFQTEEIRNTVELILSYKERKAETRQNILLDNYAKKASTDISIHPGIERARVFVEENYTKPISLEQIAHQASLSRHHCSRVFKKEVGLSFAKYLTKLRVEKAKDLLRVRGLSIAQVSASVGYKELTYFERVFKKATGCSPSIYRRKVARLAATT